MIGSIKDSIKNKTAFVLSATIVLAAVFLFALLYCIVGYRKNIQFFSDSYYYISNSSTTLYDYRASMEQFCDSQDDAYLQEAQTRLKRQRKLFRICTAEDSDMKVMCVRLLLICRMNMTR